MGDGVWEARVGHPTHGRNLGPSRGVALSVSFLEFWISPKQPNRGVWWSSWDVEHELTWMYIRPSLKVLQNPDNYIAWYHIYIILHYILYYIYVYIYFTNIVLCSILFYVIYSILLFYIILYYYIIFYQFISYCIILNHIMSYYILLYCIILYCCQISLLYY